VLHVPALLQLLTPELLARIAFRILSSAARSRSPATPATPELLTPELLTPELLAPRIAPSSTRGRREEASLVP
jgi:hypothetical protein